MRLTIYLLREGATTDANVLRSTATLEPIAVRVDDLDAAAYLIRGKAKTPTWVSDLQALADASSLVKDAESYGAVLLVKKSDRIFAITFGTGFHAVDPKWIEPGFGLRVTANLVAAGRIRGAQTRGVASNTRDQRTVLPTDGSFSDLDVQVDEDWLRQLTGKPDSAVVASALSGADSLRLTVPDFEMRSIGAKLEEVLEAFGSEDFRAKFPFIDHISPLPPTDTRIALLNERVAQRITNEDEAIGFAAPDPFDRNEANFDHYEFACGRDGRFLVDELGSSAVYSVTRQLQKVKDVLNEVRVAAVDEEGEAVDKVRPLLSYVLAEQELDGAEYLLTAGSWFVVQSDFVKSINDQVARIRDVTDELDLPIWDVAALKAAMAKKSDTIEGLYNESLEKGRGYALLDKKLAYLGPHEKLEVADLLTPDGYLLCVKAASKSPALSHLVAQAVNSAGVWGSEAHQSVLQAAWSSLPGAGGSKLERTDATYVLAIATSKEGPLHETLFFFTKVLLANGLRSIAGAQIDIALARIPMKVGAPAKKERKKPTRKGPTFA